MFGRTGVRLPRAGHARRLPCPLSDRQYALHRLLWRSRCDRGPGASALTALAAAVDPGKLAGKDEEALHRRLKDALSGVADPLGTFYRYSLAATVLADRTPEVEQ